METKVFYNHKKIQIPTKIMSIARTADKFLTASALLFKSNQIVTTARIESMLIEIELMDLLMRQFPFLHSNNYLQTRPLKNTKSRPMY
jgi:hypothetical protein